MSPAWLEALGGEGPPLPLGSSAHHNPAGQVRGAGELHFILNSSLSFVGACSVHSFPASSPSPAEL